MTRRFEYGVLFSSLDMKSRDAEGYWATTTTWTTDSGSEDFDDPIAHRKHLSRLGEEGWELVGPPEVERYVGVVGSPSVTNPGTTAYFDYGNWKSKRFWMKRELGS